MTVTRRAISAPSGVSIKDPILPQKKLAEVAAMIKVYPVLYGLENSIRELIKRVMSDKFGKDWWDTQLTTSKLRGVRDTANGRMTQEKTKHSWHQRRGSHPIDYVQFDDLEKILRAKKASISPAHHSRLGMVASPVPRNSSVTPCRVPHESARFRQHERR